MSETEFFLFVTVLSETLTPEEVSARVGMKADRSWHLGTPKPGARVPSRWNGWELVYRSTEDPPLGEHLAELLKRVNRPQAEALRALRPDARVEVGCSVYHRGSSTPELYFPNELLVQINEMGANLGLDLYML